MIDKTVADAVTALAHIPDGAALMVGGFGNAGQLDTLVDGLIARGAGDLTIIDDDNAGNGERGLAALLAVGRVKKAVRRRLLLVYART